MNRTILLLYFISQVLPNYGLMQLKNSFASSENPLLLKILKSVDAVTSDKHLFDVTLKLLKSLCFCMHESLHAKEEKILNDNNVLANPDKRDLDRRVLDIYKKIYSNACFNLREVLTSRHNISFVVNDTEFMNNTNCANHEKNFDNIFSIDGEKVNEINNFQQNTKIEHILLKTLMSTRDLHKYIIKRYHVVKKNKQAKKLSKQTPRNIIIITLFLNTEKINQNNFNIGTEDNFIKALYSNSTINIDIIDTNYDRKLNDSVKSSNVTYTDCNLQSIFKFIAESESNNLTRVFKIQKKNEAVRLYIEIISNENYTDYVNDCCEHKKTSHKCMEYLDHHFKIKDNLIKSKIDKKYTKDIYQQYKQTVTKLRKIVNSYDQNWKIKKSNTTHTKNSLMMLTPTPKNLDNVTKISTENVTSNVKYPLNLNEVTEAIIFLTSFVDHQINKQSVTFPSVRPLVTKKTTSNYVIDNYEIPSSIEKPNIFIYFTNNTVNKEEHYSDVQGVHTISSKSKESQSTSALMKALRPNNINKNSFIDNMLSTDVLKSENTTINKYLDVMMDIDKEANYMGFENTETINIDSSLNLREETNYDTENDPNQSTDDNPQFQNPEARLDATNIGPILFNTLISQDNIDKNVNTYSLPEFSLDTGDSQVKSELFLSENDKLTATKSLNKVIDVEQDTSNLPQILDETENKINIVEDLILSDNKTLSTTNIRNVITNSKENSFRAGNSSKVTTLSNFDEDTFKTAISTGQYFSEYLLHKHFKPSTLNTNSWTNALSGWTTEKPRFITSYDKPKFSDNKIAVIKTPSRKIDTSTVSFNFSKRSVFESEYTIVFNDTNTINSNSFKMLNYETQKSICPNNVSCNNIPKVSTEQNGKLSEAKDISETTFISNHYITDNSFDKYNSDKEISHNTSEKVQNITKAAVTPTIVLINDGEQTQMLDLLNATSQPVKIVTTPSTDENAVVSTLNEISPENFRGRDSITTYDETNTRALKTTTKKELLSNTNNFLVSPLSEREMKNVEIKLFPTKFIKTTRKPFFASKNNIKSTLTTYDFYKDAQLPNIFNKHIQNETKETFNAPLNEHTYETEKQITQTSNSRTKRIHSKSTTLKPRLIETQNLSKLGLKADYTPQNNNDNMDTIRYTLEKNQDNLKLSATSISEHVKYLNLTTRKDFITTVQSDKRDFQHISNASKEIKSKHPQTIINDSKTNVTTASNVGLNDTSTKNKPLNYSLIDFIDTTRKQLQESPDVIKFPNKSVSTRKVIYSTFTTSEEYLVNNVTLYDKQVPDQLTRIIRNSSIGIHKSSATSSKEITSTLRVVKSNIQPAAFDINEAMNKRNVSKPIYESPLKRVPKVTELNNVIESTYTTVWDESQHIMIKSLLKPENVIESTVSTVSKEITRAVIAELPHPEYDAVVFRETSQKADNNFETLNKTLNDRGTEKPHFTEELKKLIDFNEKPTQERKILGSSTENPLTQNIINGFEQTVSQNTKGELNTILSTILEGTVEQTTNEATQKATKITQSSFISPPEYSSSQFEVIINKPKQIFKNIIQPRVPKINFQQSTVLPDLFTMSLKYTVSDMQTTTPSFKYVLNKPKEETRHIESTTESFQQAINDIELPSITIPEENVFNGRSIYQYITYDPNENVYDELLQLSKGDNRPAEKITNDMLPDKLIHDQNESEGKPNKQLHEDITTSGKTFFTMQSENPFIQYTPDELRTVRTVPIPKRVSKAYNEIMTKSPPYLKGIFQISTRIPDFAFSNINAEGINDLFAKESTLTVSKSLSSNNDLETITLEDSFPVKQTENLLIQTAQNEFKKNMNLTSLKTLSTYETTHLTISEENKQPEAIYLTHTPNEFRNTLNKKIQSTTFQESNRSLDTDENTVLKDTVKSTQRSLLNPKTSQLSTNVNESIFKTVSKEIVNDIQTETVFPRYTANKTKKISKHSVAKDFNMSVNDLQTEKIGFTDVFGSLKIEEATQPSNCNNCVVESSVPAIITTKLSNYAKDIQKTITTKSKEKNNSDKSPFNYLRNHSTNILKKPTQEANALSVPYFITISKGTIDTMHTKLPNLKHLKSKPEGTIPRQLQDTHNMRTTFVSTTPRVIASTIKNTTNKPPTKVGYIFEPILIKQPKNILQTVHKKNKRYDSKETLSTIQEVNNQSLKLINTSESNFTNISQEKNSYTQNITSERALVEYNITQQPQDLIELANKSHLKDTLNETKPKNLLTTNETKEKVSKQLIVEDIFQSTATIKSDNVTKAFLYAIKYPGYTTLPISESSYLSMDMFNTERITHVTGKSEQAKELNNNNDVIESLFPSATMIKLSQEINKKSEPIFTSTSKDYLTTNKLYTDQAAGSLNKPLQGAQTTSISKYITNLDDTFTDMHTTQLNSTYYSNKSEEIENLINITDMSTHRPSQDGLSKIPIARSKKWSLVKIPVEVRQNDKLRLKTTTGDFKAAINKSSKHTFYENTLTTDSRYTLNVNPIDNSHSKFKETATERLISNNEKTIDVVSAKIQTLPVEIPKKLEHMVHKITSTNKTLKYTTIKDTALNTTLNDILDSKYKYTILPKNTKTNNRIANKKSNNGNFILFNRTVIDENIKHSITKPSSDSINIDNENKNTIFKPSNGQVMDSNATVSILSNNFRKSQFPNKITKMTTNNNTFHQPIKNSTVAHIKSDHSINKNRITAAPIFRDNTVKNKLFHVKTTKSNYSLNHSHNESGSQQMAASTDLATQNSTYDDDDKKVLNRFFFSKELIESSTLKPTKISDFTHSNSKHRNDHYADQFKQSTNKNETEAKTYPITPTVNSVNKIDTFKLSPITTRSQTKSFNNRTKFISHTLSESLDKYSPSTFIKPGNKGDIPSIEITTIPKLKMNPTQYESSTILNNYPESTSQTNVKNKKNGNNSNYELVLANTDSTNINLDTRKVSDLSYTVQNIFVTRKIYDPITHGNSSVEIKSHSFIVIPLLNKTTQLNAEDINYNTATSINNLSVKNLSKDISTLTIKMVSPNEHFITSPSNFIMTNTVTQNFLRNLSSTTNETVDEPVTSYSNLINYIVDKNKQNTISTGNSINDDLKFTTSIPDNFTETAFFDQLVTTVNTMKGIQDDYEIAHNFSQHFVTSPSNFTMTNTDNEPVTSYSKLIDYIDDKNKQNTINTGNSINDDTSIPNNLTETADQLVTTGIVGTKKYIQDDYEIIQNLSPKIINLNRKSLNYLFIPLHHKMKTKIYILNQSTRQMLLNRNYMHKNNFTPKMNNDFLPFTSNIYIYSSGELNEVWDEQEPPLTKKITQSLFNMNTKTNHVNDIGIKSEKSKNPHNLNNFVSPSSSSRRYFTLDNSHLEAIKPKFFPNTNILSPKATKVFTRRPVVSKESKKHIVYSETLTENNDNLFLLHRSTSDSRTYILGNSNQNVSPLLPRKKVFQRTKLTTNVTDFPTTHFQTEYNSLFTAKKVPNVNVIIKTDSTPKNVIKTSSSNVSRINNYQNLTKINHLNTPIKYNQPTNSATNLLKSFVTKSIKYNTYQPLTKEQIELLKSSPSTVGILMNKSAFNNKNVHKTTVSFSNNVSFQTSLMTRTSHQTESKLVLFNNNKTTLKTTTAALKHIKPQAHIDNKIIKINRNKYANLPLKNSIHVNQIAKQNRFFKNTIRGPLTKTNLFPVNVPFDGRKNLVDLPYTRRKSFVKNYVFNEHQKQFPILPRPKYWSDQKPKSSYKYRYRINKPHYVRPFIDAVYTPMPRPFHIEINPYSPQPELRRKYKSEDFSSEEQHLSTKNAGFNNLERWAEVQVKQSKRLKEQIQNSIQHIMTNTAKHLKTSRRPWLKEVNRWPLSEYDDKERTDIPSGFHIRKSNREMPTRLSQKKLNRGRTIFFLSPTGAESHYFDI